MLLPSDMITELLFTIEVLHAAPCASQLRRILWNPRAHTSIGVIFPMQRFIAAPGLGTHGQGKNVILRHLGIPRKAYFAVRFRGEK